ncbi:MAG: hypothetical protein AAF921_07365 [Cyanobacteria bacterium P01_D01_bin.44]
MMAQYVTLMASLPPIGQLFEANQPPISQLKLNSRLKMLTARDTLRLDQIASLVAWRQQPMERSDAQFIAEAKRFFETVRNPVLREIMAYRLDLRTIVAALRRRHRGERVPPVNQPWGVGPWVSYIERHWTEPGFHLEVMFPWVLEANQYLDAQDSVALERLQFEINWKLLDRLETGHYFDFEAVVIYLMRWSLVQRWTSYDGAVAVERFGGLAESGLGRFSNLFTA